MASYTYTFVDHSNESSVIRFGCAEPAAGGADYDSIVTTNQNAFLTLLNDITLCRAWKEAVIVNEADNGKLPLPTSQWAQREQGLRIFYEDITLNKQHHITIPGPDLTLTDLVQPGTDNVLLDGATEMADLVTAMESYILSPAGNAILVRSAKIVGRNS